MKPSILYILSVVQSFVKNEVQALRQRGATVKLVLLSETSNDGASGWSYIAGSDRSAINVADKEEGHSKKVLRLLAGSCYLTRKGRLKGILNSLSMVWDSSYPRYLAFYHLRRAVDIARIVASRGFQRIHTHFAWGNAHVCAFTSELLDIPFSLTVHADDIFGLNQSEKARLKWLLDRAHDVITISHFNKNYLVNQGLCLEDKIRVIHCGVPVDKFDFRNHVYKKGVFRFITIPSGFVDKKGLGVLIDAIQMLLYKNKNIECLVVGSDFGSGRRAKYEDKVSKAGIGANVKFVGAIPQSRLADLYRKCHAFVLPSIADSKGKMDGIPVSLMEAMALGLPVVSTKISGIPELIEDGREGLLAKPNDATELALRLEHLIKEPKAALKMAKAARTKIEKEFNITKISLEISRVFVDSR